VCFASGWPDAPAAKKPIRSPWCCRNCWTSQASPGHQAWDFQIYATDLDDDAIATARAGRYPPNIAQDVTPERLRQFFVREDEALASR
jgi:chemotaxis methyl-accepting protein methylase